MIKVAFLGSGYSKEWMGGVNYINNLLYAIAQLEDKKIEPIVFLGMNVDEEIKKKLSKNAQIVQDSLFDMKSFKWYVHKIIEKFLKKTPLLNPLLKKYGIKVVSHSDIKEGCESFVKINWIPDFQHVHLPEFFSEEENKKRDVAFSNILRKSDCVIVSSHNAYVDAKEFSPDNIDKVRVLQFVSQPNDRVFSLTSEYITTLEKKYGFEGKFFYLPNQFWKHKNHMLVFKAVKALKDQGVNVLLLCSGHMKDFRNPLYIEEVKYYLKENSLEKNIKLLGLIDYDDVLYFMKYSVTVINPSLFEGWSSTVEECKSIGKNMILSDIKIHREQNPQNSFYFHPKEVSSLVEVIQKAWNSLGKENLISEIEAKEKLQKRTAEFADTYQNIVLDTINNKEIR